MHVLMGLQEVPGNVSQSCEDVSNALEHLKGRDDIKATESYFSVGGTSVFG